MDRNQLLRLKWSIEEMEYAINELSVMLKLLNLTESERNRLIDSMVVLQDTINEIKQSNLSELHNRVNLEYLQ